MIRVIWAATRRDSLLALRRAFSLSVARILSVHTATTE